MLNVNVSELNNRISVWDMQRGDLLAKAEQCRVDAQALSSKIASAKIAVELIESIMKDEQTEQPAPKETAEPELKPSTATKTYVNPEIQVSRWAPGELEDAVLIVLRRENEPLSSTEIMNAIVQNRGRKVIETSLYNCLHRMMQNKKITAQTRNGRTAYKAFPHRSATVRHA